MARPYNPTLYALVHRGNAGDAAFYRSCCEGAGSVLELGCGFGRLIPVLANTCQRYRGLEIDPGLLALAAEARRSLPTSVRLRTTLHQADMRTFRFRTRFDRIVLPHSGLYCLGSDRDVLKCLMRVRAQLADDGELILDAYNADGFHAALEESDMTGQERDSVACVEAADARYEVFERTRWHKVKQQLSVTYEYESADKKVRKGFIRHRYLLRSQLEALLARAGLKPTIIAGSFLGKKHTRQSAHLIVRARPR